MAAVAAITVVKDGNGNTVAGGVRTVDESGVGTGPYDGVAVLYGGSGVAGAAEVLNADEAGTSTKYGLLARVVGLLSYLGSLAETAPATDTASSGLNGRLQRVAQRLAAGAANIGKAEDVASADADVGVPAYAILKATPADTAGTDGDYQALQMKNGRLWASAVLEAGETHIGITADTYTIPAGGSFTRPADTTAYTSGDLVANSTTAASVVALSFTTAARVSGGNGVVRAARIMKSTNSVTNAAFRLHLFSVVPTFVTNGDNTAMTTVVVATSKGYLGYIDITAMTGFSDVAWGTGGPDNSRAGVQFVAAVQTLFGILEARGAYTPGNAEVFTVDLLVQPN